MTPATAWHCPFWRSTNPDGDSNAQGLATLVACLLLWHVVPLIRSCHRPRRVQAAGMGTSPLCALCRRMNPCGAECISPADFARGIKSLNMHLEPDTARRMFAAVDANSDGALSYQEFATAFEVPRNDPPGSVHAAALFPAQVSFKTGCHCRACGAASRTTGLCLRSRNARCSTRVFCVATPVIMQAYCVSAEEAASAKSGALARALQHKLHTSEEAARRVLRRCTSGPHGGRPGIRRLRNALNMLSADSVPVRSFQ